MTSADRCSSVRSRLPAPALLFCPADRPDRYAKALDAADLVVLDLEDAVAEDRKDIARRALAEKVVEPDRVVVRVNGTGSAHHDADLEALRRTPYRRVMLPKAESAEQVDRLARWDVIVLCETARGVLAASELAAAEPTVALMWGAEDLVASTGGRSSRHLAGGYRDLARHARSTVLLAAAANGRAAIDAVYIDVRDLNGLAAEAEDAAAVGFDLKACIHPSQLDVVRRAFVPTETELEWAQSVLAAAAGTGVKLVGGQMIDAPLIRQAEQILAAATDVAVDMTTEG